MNPTSFLKLPTNVLHGVAQRIMLVCTSGDHEGGGDAAQGIDALLASSDAVIAPSSRDEASSMGSASGEAARATTSLHGTALRFPTDSNAPDTFWTESWDAWEALLNAMAPKSDGEGPAHDGDRGLDVPVRSVVLTCTASLACVLLCHALGLPPDARTLFRLSAGGVTVLDFPDGALEPCIVRCVNQTLVE